MRPDPRAEAAPTPGSHDPDLDPPRGRPPVRLEPDFARYQRLVANPFLALTALLAWFAAVRLALSERNLVLLLFLVAGLVGVAWLLQFHCRDCGTTGTLFRWRGHACEAAIARQLSGRPRRFRGPNPTTQTVLWGYLVLIVTFLVLVTFRWRW